MTWKDEILLREMERFEARDRKATGPRAAMPDDSPVGCNWQWGGPTDPNERDLETENRELRNQWQYLCGELKARSGIISDAIQARETFKFDAARNRRAFRIASVIAAIATAAAWAGWLR